MEQKWFFLSYFVVMLLERWCILRQHRVLRNLRKYKDIAITKPNKGNGAVILDRKLYNNAIEEVISDTVKFEMLNEDLVLKCKASLQGVFK